MTASGASAGRRLVVAVVTSVVAAAGLVAVGATSAQAGSSDSTMLRQRATIAWYGKDYQRNDNASVVVPGIGTARLVCRRDRTTVTIKPDDRSQETQLWSSIHQTKTDAFGSEYESVAVKTARVYRYANADDDGKGGTGGTATEGLNQVGPRIEDSSRGYMTGVISQRPGRQQQASGASLPPTTSFTIRWDWSGYRGSAKTSRCNVTGVFDTKVGTERGDAKRAVKDADASTVRLGGQKVRVGVTARTYRGRSADIALSWHGDADAARRPAVSRTIAGLGTVRISCPTGIGSEALLTIDPERSKAGLYTETTSGEGDVADHVESEYHGLDATTGRLTPVSLPLNGMVHGELTVGSRKVDLDVSSYRVTNNAEQPHLNVCEVAVAVTPA